MSFSITLMLSLFWLLSAFHAAWGVTCRRVIEVHDSIQKAVERAYPGDCVVIYPGEYYESIHTVRSGLPGKPIVIIGIPRVVIHGSPSAGGRVIYIRHSHIWLERLEVDGHFSPSEKGARAYKDKLIYIKGSLQSVVRDIRVVDCVLKNALGECLRVKRAEDVEIKGNSISYCGLRDFRFGRGRKNGEAVYIGTAPEQTAFPDRTKRVSVVENVLFPHGSECVDVKEGSEDVVVKDNVCAYTLDPSSGGVSVRGSHAVIEGNLFYSLAGAGVRLGGDGKKNGIMNSVLNNLFLDRVRLSIKVMREPQGKICGNWAVSPKLYVSPGLTSRFEEAFKPCR